MTNAPLRCALRAPFGWLMLTLVSDRLTGVELASARHGIPLAGARLATRRIGREFEAYFDDARHRPDIACRADGTRFQHRVWGALARIPAGVVRTYGDLARSLVSGARCWTGMWCQPTADRRSLSSRRRTGRDRGLQHCCRAGDPGEGVALAP